MWVPSQVVLPWLEPLTAAGVGKKLLGLMVVPNPFPLSFLHLSRVRRVYWWGQRPTRFHCQQNWELELKTSFLSERK